MIIANSEAIKMLRELAKTDEGKSTLEPYISRLNPRERRVIELRIGLTEAGSLTLKCVSEQLCVSKQRISVNEGKALRRFRNWSDDALFTKRLQT